MNRDRRIAAVRPLGLVIASVAAGSMVGGALADRSPIDGRWNATLTRSALIRTGEVDAAGAGKIYGPYTASFGDGRFRFSNARTGLGAEGTFTVAGGIATFVYAYGVLLRPGSVAVCALSVFHGRLTFAKVHGRPCWALEAAAWTTAR
jgi:hypothetical protein